MLRKKRRSIENEQSRETGNIWHIRHMTNTIRVLLYFITGNSLTNKFKFKMETHFDN
jgi:hypothetical protein